MTLGLAGCSGSAAAVSPPGGTPTKFVPAFADVDYTPAGVTANAYQHLNVFHPIGPVPPTGWPLLVFALLPGHESETPKDEITASIPLEYGALAAGVAVVSCGMTGTDDPTVPGQGTFDPPGETASDQDHYGLDTFPSCYKDAAWVIQYLRFHADDFDLDPDRFYVGGRSGSATAMAWVALGEDRADPSAGDFRVASSRVQGAALSAAQLWWPGLLQDMNTFGALFPLASDPLNTVAKKISETFPEYPKLASALYYGFKDDAVQAANARTAFFLYANSGTDHTDFSLTTGEAFPVPVLADEITDPHDPWFEYMLFQRLLDLDQASGTGFHAANSALYVGSGAALDTIESGVIESTDLIDFELAWLLQRLDLVSEPAPATAGQWFLKDGDGELYEGAWAEPAGE